MDNKNDRKDNLDLLTGRQALSEALKAGRELNQIFVARGNRSGSIGKIISQGREKGIPIKEIDPKKLDYMCGKNHQGVAAFCAPHKYAEVSDILNAAKEKNEAPFIIICDEIEDPHNLGAIIRTAEASGAHGIIIPKRRSAYLTGIVSKTSAGAVEYMPVARVSNLVQTIDLLKKENIWIYCLDMDGTDYTESDYSGGAALVIGSEGRGVGRLIKEKCDFTVSIPMKGKINSLNASVAAGIVMYQISKNR